MSVREAGWYWCNERETSESFPFYWNGENWIAILLTAEVSAPAVIGPRIEPPKEDAV